MKVIQVTMWEDDEGFRHETRLGAIRADLINELYKLDINEPSLILDNARTILSILETYKLEGGTSR